MPQYQVGKILCMKYTQKEHQLQFPIAIVPPKKGAQIFSVVILLANSANLALYAYLRLFADPIGLMSPRWERYNTNILCHTLKTSKMRFTNNRLTSLQADKTLLGSIRLCRAQLNEKI